MVMTNDEKHDSVPSPDGVEPQKYHHGPCNAHCRCGRESTKPERRFCACGQEVYFFTLVADPMCGDCRAHYNKPHLTGESLDTRIAAARAVTDEAEGAWSTPHGEGP